MYNSFTLRAFITGVNPQLSHVLRCRNPDTIEEAIQIVTDEENINYHRNKIGATTQNKPAINTTTKPAFQLRINSPQTRQSHSSSTPAPQFKKFTPPLVQKWTPRPFPAKHPFFQQQNHSQRPQAGPSSGTAPGTSKMYQPTPMEVDSDRTRLTKHTYRPGQPKYKVEELTTQEVEASDYQNYTNFEDTEYEQEYEAYETQEENPIPDNENFPISASDTQNTNQ